jgi:hypothetical protein
VPVPDGARIRNFVAGVFDMNQIDNIMEGIKPDTHCWDDDTGKDVWSYSEGLVRAAIEQLHAENAKLRDADVVRERIERLRYLHEQILEVVETLSKEVLK